MKKRFLTFALFFLVGCAGGPIAIVQEEPRVELEPLITPLESIAFDLENIEEFEDNRAQYERLGIDVDARISNDIKDMFNDVLELDLELYRKYLEQNK